METEPHFNSEQEREPQVEIISAETLQQLSLIWQKLQGFIQKDTELRDSHGPLPDNRAIKEHRKRFMQDYRAQKKPGEIVRTNRIFDEADKKLFAPFEQETLKVAKEMMNYLDRMAVFDYKFTTTGTSFEHPDKTVAQDSIYYMTPEGITLRLKMVHAQKSLGRITQPFMEKIVFAGQDAGVSGGAYENNVTFKKEGISLSPVPGYSVNELSSKPFHQLVHQGNAREIKDDLHSLVSLKDNGDDTVIFSAEDMMYAHEGHGVGKILFEPGEIFTV